MQPIQDLHGYANPWPAGGGKNLFQTTATSKTESDVTWTVNEDGSITASGTATGTTTILAGAASVDASMGNVAISLDGVSIDTNISINYVRLYDANGNQLAVIISGGLSIIRTVFDLSQYANAAEIRVSLKRNNNVATNGTVHIQVEKGTSYTDWTPYSNICPITGRTGVTVYVSPTPDPGDATTYSSDWTSPAGTVYGGTVDPVSGRLTINGIVKVLDGNESFDGTYWPTVVCNTELPDVGDYNRRSEMRCSHCATGTRGVGFASSSAIKIQFKNTDEVFGVNNATGFATYVATQYANGTPVTVYYPLATPITYQLTAQEVAALVGTNNVWSDAESVTVTYTKDTGSQATLSGAIVTFSDSNAVLIPTPQYIPGITGISIYRYLQGEYALQHVYDLATGATSILDYYAPSQMQVSYLIVAHSGVGDLFLQTNDFVPIFWFYSVLLCDTDSNGNYHVSREYIFKYGVETGSVSNNNDPTIQKNFTPYPNRQPISTLYKTGKVSGYIGKTNNLNQYSDSISLQNAIYDISVSTLDKFLKSRKGDVIKVDTASSIQMKTEDNTVQQALKATVDWVEVGEASQVSIVSVPSDSFWPIS